MPFDQCLKSETSSHIFEGLNAFSIIIKGSRKFKNKTWKIFELKMEGIQKDLKKINFIVVSIIFVSLVLVLIYICIIFFHDADHGCCFY